MRGPSELAGEGGARSAKRARPRHRSAISADETRRPDRRADILRAAEYLFAERGYAAVSVRDIAGRADVPLALVGYYFGRKPELFSSIFEHRRAHITERMDRMAEVDCSPGNPRAVEDLVRAWAEPVIQLRGRGGEAFSLLVARTTWDPGTEARAVIERFYDGIALAFISGMTTALPDRARLSIVWGYEYALGALLMHVADARVERLSGGEAMPGDPRLGDTFVKFLASAFQSLPRGSSAQP